MEPLAETVEQSLPRRLAESLQVRGKLIELCRAQEQTAEFYRQLLASWETTVATLTDQLRASAVAAKGEAADDDQRVRASAVVETSERNAVVETSERDADNAQQENRRRGDKRARRRRGERDPDGDDTPERARRRRGEREGRRRCQHTGSECDNDGKVDDEPPERARRRRGEREGRRRGQHTGSECDRDGKVDDEPRDKLSDERRDDVEVECDNDGKVDERRGDDEPRDKLSDEHGDDNETDGDELEDDHTKLKGEHCDDADGLMEAKLEGELCHDDEVNGESEHFDDDSAWDDEQFDKQRRGREMDGDDEGKLEDEQFDDDGREPLPCPLLCPLPTPPSKPCMITSKKMPTQPKHSPALHLVPAEVQPPGIPQRTPTQPKHSPPLHLPPWRQPKIRDLVRLRSELDQP
jgi:hypothetical protein